MTEEVQKYLEEFLSAMNRQEKMVHGSSLLRFSCYLTQEAQKITAVLNQDYHTPEEIRRLFGELTGSLPDKNFKLNPPFYTDCGRNIHLGKRVFINSCCCFQDQGGIEIGDDVQIGHGVKILTLNHGLKAEDRSTLYPEKVVIKNNVWIGSGAILLPGIIIEENAVVGAGSVVTKNVPEGAVVAGNPAQIIL